MAANEENPKPIEADDDVSLFTRFISKLSWNSIYLQEEKEMATITVHVKTPKEKKSISVGDKSSVKDVSKNSSNGVYILSVHLSFSRIFHWPLSLINYVNILCLTCHNIHCHFSSKPKYHPNLTTHPWISFAWYSPAKSWKITRLWKRITSRMAWLFI